jgi:O-antigen/teichoic acid export membrane protein
VVAGFGVWALGTAVVVRPLVTAIVLLRLSGLGLLRPSLASIPTIRPLVGFGIRFQGVSLAIVVRDQGLNAVTGLVAGVATLGLWSFVNRLMQVPLIFFQALWRVSFPAMSQLLAAKDDPAPAIERSVALSATTSALMLSGFAAATPELVPSIFGGHWREAGLVMPWACFALLLAGPVSVSTVGFLYAANRPGSVLRAAVLFAVTWIGVAAVLLPFVGVSALGIGWVAGALADSVTLTIATKRISSARIGRPLAAPLAIGVLSGLGGLLFASLEGDGIWAAAAGGAVALALCAGGLYAVNRRLLAETLSMILRSVRAATTRRRTPEPDTQPAAV